MGSQIPIVLQDQLLLKMPNLRRWVVPKASEIPAPPPDGVVVTVAMAILFPQLLCLQIGALVVPLPQLQPQHPK